MASPSTVDSMIDQSLAEIRGALTAIPPGTAERLVAEVVAARRIACYGIGREGLMLRAFAMRLMHLGFNAHVVGDMVTPPVGPGDLVIVSCGTGWYSMGQALIETATTAGARVLTITAQPDGVMPRLADVILHLPAQTMANDQGQSAPSLLPMGSLFEIAELVFFDLVSILLRDQTGQSPDQMRARHTNLE